MFQLLLFNVTNGLIIGAFYVLMALGLSLILNLSNVINFAHGGFLVVGGYIAYTITPYVGFWGALLIAPPLTAAIGLATERVLIRPLYGRDPLYSLLLTFGLAFIFEDGTRFIWGAQGKPVTVPAILAQPLSNEFFFITGYRLFMVLVVIIAVSVLFVLLRFTRLGIRIRAGHAKQLPAHVHHGKRIAELLRQAADVSADEHLTSEAAGLRAISHGFRLLHGKDDERKLQLAAPMYDALYAYCEAQAAAGRGRQGPGADY